MFLVERSHEISCGHRVYGHESKCAHLHGHNYRIHFTVAAAKLDAIGRVIDFGQVKQLLCQWLEDRWDHKMLLFRDDPLAQPLYDADPQGVVIVPFNPTAENMARFLVENVAPAVLAPLGLVLIRVMVWETTKCCGIYEVHR